MKEAAKESVAEDERLIEETEVAKHLYQAKKVITHRFICMFFVNNYMHVCLIHCVLLVLYRIRTHGFLKNCLKSSAVLSLKMSCAQFLENCTRHWIIGKRF